MRFSSLVGGSRPVPSTAGQAGGKAKQCCAAWALRAGMCPCKKMQIEKKLPFFLLADGCFFIFLAWTLVIIATMKKIIIMG